MVDRPVGVEAEWFDQAGEVEVLLVDLLVGHRRRTGPLRLETVPVRVVLEIEMDTDLHDHFLGSPTTTVAGGAVPSSGARSNSNQI